VFILSMLVKCNVMCKWSLVVLYVVCGIVCGVYVVGG